ncbi:MAG: hypothetical protein LBN39_08755 [Planctomycetaceae bacterium]|jgi:hypothetical protein|nr:hypothetical protein [Planctomycetaceae bacterium]
MNYVKYFAPVLLVYFVSAASAQYNPPMSPWLNLYNNNGRNALGNYLTNVKPQIDYNQKLQQLQQNQGAIQQALANPAMGTTTANQLLNDDSTQRILTEPRMTKSIGGQNGANFNQTLHWYQGGLPRHQVPYFTTPRTGRRF